MTGGAFAELVDAELSGVMFVRDYLQLGFDPPPTLNLYTPVTVRVAGRSYLRETPGFADALIGQVGKVVVEIAVLPAVSLELRFADGSSISASLKPEDYVGPEAAVLS